MAGRPAEAPRVEAVERALLLLEAFSDGTPRLALSELAARTGLYPSTVLRLAASLDRFGYLHRGADGLFRLGPTPLRLGALYRDAFDLADHVRPALARLVERTGETAAFYVREGERRVCLYRQHSPRPIRHHVEEGAALPLDRGAAGHVLMAYTGTADPRHEALREPRPEALRDPRPEALREPRPEALRDPRLEALRDPRLEALRDPRLEALRARGWDLSLGERDPETAAIAAPVFGRGRQFLGALGIVGPRARFEAGDQAAVARVLTEEAAGLSRGLGG